MSMTMTLEAGTISFQHSKPPRGAHKTYAPWLDRKLEKVEPIQLSSDAYNQIVGAYISTRDCNPFRERRSDNKLVAVIGGEVFSDSEYKRKRAERLAREQQAGTRRPTGQAPP